MKTGDEHISKMREYGHWVSERGGGPLGEFFRNDGKRHAHVDPGYTVEHRYKTNSAFPYPPPGGGACVSPVRRIQSRR